MADVRLFEVYLSSTSGKYVEGKVLAKNEGSALVKAKRLLATEKDHEYYTINTERVREVDVKLVLK